MAMLGLLSLSLAATRYHLCDFSCGEETRWSSCRAERCSPRLPEDLCPDGSEPTLSPEGSVREGDGRPLASPLECEAWGVVTAGSFTERCEICMRLASEMLDLLRRSSQDLDADSACTIAGGVTQEMLPQLRTCYLQPELCADQLTAHANSSDEHSVCRSVWDGIEMGKRVSMVQEEAQHVCGSLLSLRAGSNVTDAQVCPAPRDVEGRIMALSAVVAVFIFMLQWTQS